MNPPRPTLGLLLVTGLYVIRMVINIAHGHAHDTLAVPLEPWQQVFVWLVIVIAPSITLAWLWFRPGAGLAWLLAGILIASWLFGMYFHFGPMNPDHVSAQAGADAAMFKMTAQALLIIEPTTAIAAAALALKLSRRGAPSHA
jgi:hypothetical protein